jgi:hypothetical protein
MYETTNWGIRIEIHTIEWFESSGSNSLSGIRNGQKSERVKVGYKVRNNKGVDKVSHASFTLNLRVCLSVDEQ